MRFQGLRLRDGIHAVRRDDHLVQVGFDPPRRVLLRAEPEVLHVLEGLRHGTVAATGVDPSGTIAALAAADLLAPSAPAPAAETSGHVAITSYDLDLTGLEQRLASAGVSTGGGEGPAALHVVAARGPLARTRLDDLVGQGAPHLVLCGTGRPGSLRLGPFVDPGVTACLRCVDAHDAEDDPRRALIVEQLATLSAAQIDPLTLELAMAWAARDAVAYLTGARPTTWSASVDLDVDLPVVRRWGRHPWCGCAWDLVPY